MYLKQVRHSKGYDAEELYFERINRELIKQIKEQLKHESEGAPPKEEKLAQVIQFEPRNKKTAKAA